ncbi:MAG: universal stress protein [Candidatus Zixiibacteriota bacterium]|nr:MAG: universal stress protein [candidate division Zixibacteria bacterium]
MFADKILLASDLTDKSRAAERTACALAERLKVKLVILHVIPERASFGMSTTLPELSDPERLNRKLQAIGEQDAPDAVRLLRNGLQAETIVNVAETEAVDLIIVGTQGRTGISRAVLGSVAEAVVRQSTCPVMVVKPTVNMPAT